MVPLSVSQKLVTAISPPTMDKDDHAGGGGGCVTLLTMESCGHIPHEEYPDQFVGAVSSFAES